MNLPSPPPLSPLATPAPGPATVLVVDDHPATRYSTSRTLRAAGFQTLEAETGAQALALADAALAAVILDVNLPDLHGFDVCRLLRGQPDTARLPVIHLSATYTNDRDKIEGLDSGADAYLTHPADPKLLVATVRAFMRARAAEERARLGELRFRQLADAMPQIVWVTGADGQWSYLNQQWHAYAGSEPGSSPLLGWRDALHPDDRARTLALWEQALRSGEPFEAECRLHGRDSQYRWFLARALPVREDSGEISRWFGTCTDIDDQKRHAELLQRVARASQNVNQLLSAESIAQALLDEARRLLGGQAAVLRAQAEAPQHAATEAVSPAGAPGAALQRLARTLAAEPPGTLAAALPPATLAVPLLGRGGLRMGLLLMQRDAKAPAFTSEDESVLTQLAAVAATGIENARLYESLRDEGRRKDEFLATLAHELRNPLAPIRTGLMLLERHLAAGGAATSAGSRTVDMMNRQLAHMVRLIDDLLDVSRITSGKIDLRPERLDVRTVFDNAVEASRPTIDGSGHQLVVSLPDTPLPVRADRTRLAQVVSNLLTNAAKYTDAGGRIELSAAVEGERVALRVRDNGIGLAPEMLPQVWEMFSQVNGQHARAQGGLGIGLTLVRRLVEMHGGQVQAESAGLGLGSTFTVRLPLADAQTPADAGIAPVAAVEALPQPGRRVLIVDDNVDAAESLAVLLSLAGHATVVAHDGEAALAAARAQAPDLVLLDIGLPTLSGYEIAARLRGELGLKRTTLVALTGWGSEDDRRRSREAGFDFHLVKPVDADQLDPVFAHVMGDGR